MDLRRAGLASDDDQGMLGLSAFALDEGPVDAARRGSASWPTRPRSQGRPSPPSQADALDLTRNILAPCEAGKAGDTRPGVRSP